MFGRPRSRAERVAAQGRRVVRGATAESVAASYLAREGFTILGRNVRVGRLEVDLVARDDDVVVIVEVRSRAPSAYGNPFRSIDWKKARRVRRAGEVLWRIRFRSDPTLTRMRFDVVAVTFAADDVRVEHARAAF